MITVVDVAGGAKHGAMGDSRALTIAKPRGKGYAAHVSGDGVPNQHMELRPVEDKDEAVAAAEDPASLLQLQGEELTREAVRGVQGRGEG